LTTKGLRWRDGDIPMSLQLDDTMTARVLIDGKNSWNAVAREALNIWNDQLSHVQFTTFSSTQRGDGDNHNEVFFSSNIFGHAFGDGVLAITTAWKVGSERVEGDTVVNDAINWDSYRGSLYGFDDSVDCAAFSRTSSVTRSDSIIPTMPGRWWSLS